MEFSGRNISSIFFHIMRMGYHQRKTAAKRFFDSISQNDDFMFWMKTNLHQVVSAFILLNSEQSVIDRRLPNWVKINLLGASGQFGQALKILITGFGAFSINLDLLFDCGLLLLLALMHSVALESGILLIFWLVMASLIFLPMLFNYCKLFEKTTKMQRLLLFCGFPIFPIVTQSSTIWLMYTKTKIQFEIDALTMYSGSLSNLAKQICQTADDLWEKIEKLDKVESVLTKQRLLETSAEGQPQSYIKLLLLFLTLSLTPNALIPETIFGKHLKIYGFPSELVLAAFILFPILKNVYFYLKLIDKKQTTTGSLLLICFIFFCLLGKVVSIIAVFSPPIGLFSILGHWKERQTPFSCEVMSPPNHDGFFYGAVEGEVTKTSWSTIGGTICKDGESYKNIASGEFTEWYPEDASVYFPLNLEATCLFVVAVAIVRLLFVYLAKLVICTDFRRKTPYTHISHIIHSNIGAVPLTYTHWEAASSLHGIRLMYTQEYREMTTLLVINLFENILLLLPMMRTFFLIAERHSTLQNSIQVSCLEERSYQNALRLVVGSSIVVTGSFCFEIMLFTMYYRYAHIWKILLNQARLLDNEKIVMGEEFDPIGEKEFDCLVPDKEQPEHDLSKYVHDEKEDLVESPEEAVDPGHRVIIEMHEAKGADNPCFTEMDIVGHSSKEETMENDMKQVEPSHSEEGAIRGIEEEERANPDEEEANLDILLA